MNKSEMQAIRIKLKPIKTQKQYKEYHLLIDQLVDCPEASSEEELLELISIVVADYESMKYPIEPPDPIDAIKHRIQ